MNYGTLIKKPHLDSTEIIEKRTESSKTFSNPDGTKTWSGVVGEVHYKENYLTDTEWKEIDTGHNTDMGDHLLYDRMPFIVKVFKDKTGYEIESRKTGAIGYNYESSILEIFDGTDWQSISIN